MQIISIRFKSCFCSEKAKSQHKIKTYLTIGKIPYFYQKSSKNPEKLIVFQGFYSGQHFYPLNMAEGEGFEPPEAFTSTVFKTAAIDRSAILPYRPPQMAAVFCCFQSLSRPFLSSAPLSESVPKRRPAFGARSSAAPRFQTPFPSAVLNGVRRGRRAPKCPRPSACR